MIIVLTDIKVCNLINECIWFETRTHLLCLMLTFTRCIQICKFGKLVFAHCQYLADEVYLESLTSVNKMNDKEQPVRLTTA